MSLTVADVKRLLQSCFPPGSESLYDWDNANANIGQFFTALAGVSKTYGTDVIDTIRAEANPTSIVYNVPAWEQALGLGNSPIAKFGTLRQRQNAILSWLRQSGSFSHEDIQALVQPYFFYQDPSQIRILETDRVVLTTLHTYGDGAGFFVNGATTTGSHVFVPDDPVVSPASVRIQFTLAAGANLDQISFILDGPDGTRGSGKGSIYLGTGVLAAPTLYTISLPQFAGKPIKGQWKFSISTGLATCTVNSWAVTPVEGQGVNYDRFHNRIGQGLGSAMFEWAVVAEEAKLGTGYDLTAALRALRRMKPAHTQLAIVFLPTGAIDNCAIPDLRSATPDAAIPCS